MAKYSSLIKRIKKTFINQNLYYFDKHVPTFNKDGNFFADYFNHIIVEPLDNGKPPIFYHALSPFDVVCNKAPEIGVIFQNGEVLLNVDYSEYVRLRTAAMNVIVLQGLGVKSLSNKKVLLFGSGGIATQTVKILASELSLKEVSVINQSGDLSKISDATKESHVLINPGSLSDLSSFDVIICHTKSTKPLLSESDINNLKKGAILHSFISSTQHGEFPDQFYNADKANIITDWEQTLEDANDMKRALALGLFKSNQVIFLKDLLSEKRDIDINKDYTIYRSTGTPIQDMAMLKEMLNSPQDRT